MEDITVAFGVSSENENRRKVVNIFDERGMCVGKVYFEHKYSYIRECTVLLEVVGSSEMYV